MKLNVTPVSTESGKEYTFADNLLQDAVRGLGLVRCMRRHGIHKRSGNSAAQVVFALLVWPLLSVKSICCFVGRHLDAHLQGGKATPYKCLRRQDINW